MEKKERNEKEKKRNGSLARQMSWSIGEHHFQLIGFSSEDAYIITSP